MKRCLQPEGKPMFGEIWMCSLPQRPGSVQHGTRPVMIISNNMNNAYCPTVNIIPITSRIDSKYLPMHVHLRDCSRYGLRVQSTLLIEQIATVPSDSCSFRMGQISDSETLSQIYRAIGIQFPVVSMFAENRVA